MAKQQQFILAVAARELGKMRRTVIHCQAALPEDLT